MSRLRLASSARAILVIFAAWALYFSLRPLNFTWDGLGARLLDALYRPFPSRFVEHGLFFLAFGALYAVGFGSGRGMRRSIGCLACFCLGLELLQAAEVERHGRIGDFAIHLAAASGSLWLTTRLAGHLPQLRGAERWAPAAWRLLLAGGSTFAVLSIARAHFSTGLENWDREFRLALGNEMTGERSWVGRLSGVAFYSSSLSEDQVRTLEAVRFNTASGRDLRRSFGSVILYPLDEGAGAVVHDRAAGMPLDLFIRQPDRVRWLPQGSGLEITGPTLIASGGPAEKVWAATREGSSLTLEVACAAASSLQTGPARIVSMSADKDHRNFTIGQEGSDLTFRLRTPGNGPNGARVMTGWPGVFRDSSRRHIVITYDRGVATLFVNGRRQTGHGLYRVSAYMGINTAGTAIVALLLFFPLGICGALGWPAWRLRRRMALSLLLGWIPSVATDAGIGALMMRRGADTGLMVFSLAAVLAGCLVGDRLRVEHGEAPGE